MRAIMGLNGFDFELNQFEKELIEKFRIDISPLLGDHLIYEREIILDHLDLYITPNLKVMALEKLKLQMLNHSAFCEITYKQKVFYLDGNNEPQITDNENDFLHFAYRTMLVHDQDNAINIAYKTIEMKLVDRLIMFETQPTPIKTTLINDIYNSRGQKGFYYLANNFPDNIKIGVTVKFSIIYKLLNKDKYTKSKMTFDKYSELCKKQFANEFESKKFNRVHDLDSDNAKSIKNEAQQLLDKIDNN
jgi:hypothetical protein